MFNINTKRIDMTDYVLSVGLRLSKVSYPVIGDIVVENPKYLQKLIASSDSLNAFVNNDGIITINPNNNVNCVAIGGAVEVIKDIEITGDINDGILICDGIANRVNVVNLDDIIDDGIDFNTFYMNGTLKIGFILTTNKFVDIKVNKDITVQYIGDSDLICDMLDDIAFFYSSDVEWDEYSPIGVVKPNRINHPVQEEPEPEIDEPTEEQEEPQYTWQGSNKAFVIDDGESTYSCDNTHEHFKEALKLAIEGKFSESINLINTRKVVTEYTKGLISIKNNTLHYKGVSINSGIANRILESMAAGEDFERYIPFFEKLMTNPSRRAIYRLYDFLVANDIEIADNGDIIAWKVINNDWTDCRTSSIDNSVTGIPVTMDRNLVDDDDRVTCSTGLHACARSYIGEFMWGSRRLIRVSINPRDVVSIPVDYNDAKLRCCQYLVIEEVLSGDQ